MSATQDLDDVRLELRSLPDGMAEIAMVCPGFELTLQGEEEAMAKAIEATAEQMSLTWYDLR